MNTEELPVAFTDFLSESSFFKSDRIAESAWIQHVPFAFWLTEQIKPKLLVELGVHTGVSYFAFCQSVKANKLATLCYGVDSWKGDAHAGLYDEAIWLDVSTYNAKAYDSFSYLLKTTFNEALSYFEDNSIDLLHIDGYHTYEAVKEDFETWLPKMAANGIVVFHDIMVREREFGVYKFWTELKQQYKSFEFFHGYGLGLLALGEILSEKLRHLLNLEDDVEITKVRTVYASLGTLHAESYSATIVHNKLTHVTALHNALQAQCEHLRAQYELLNSEHEVLKKLEADKQDIPSPSESPDFASAESKEVL